jgi:putative membrane protein
MTQWDLVMDRSESTIAKVWIWHDGGADFRVPLSNYLGWLLTSWFFFAAFALY